MAEELAYEVEIKQISLSKISGASSCERTDQKWDPCSALQNARS